MERPAHDYFQRAPTPIFAPINTPLPRRMETLAVLIHLASIPFFLSLIFILGCIALQASWMAKAVRIFLFIYALYYLVDFKRPFRGGVRPSRRLMTFLAPWLRRYRSYYPVKGVLDHEAERALDDLKEHPRPLIFGSHPHGIVAIATGTNFILDPSWFYDRFPHVDVRLLTLNMNMIWPFWRDWLMALGFASVDRISCERILSKSGRDGISKGIMIVVGGAKEALDAVPGRMDLTLNSRNGFFKLALKHGALIFPVLNFGENDVYDQVDFGPLKLVQRAWHRWFGFSTPFFFGRGIFNYRFGWLPRRIPLTSVVGKPIDPGPPKKHVTSQEIDALRKQYIQALEELYKRYRDKYEIVSCPAGLRIIN